MMHKPIFGPHIGAGTESLYRSQYSHRENPLWITTNPDPCFYWRWQGTTGLFLLLAEFTARYSQCWELSETLSLKPQAYLIKTHIAYIRQNTAKPQFVMHKQVIRPHFAISTCCTVLSSRGDDPSWIQYEALFLLSMKSQEQTFYCSYLPQMHHIQSRPCSSDRSPLVWT